MAQLLVVGRENITDVLAHHLHRGWHLVLAAADLHDGVRRAAADGLGVSRAGP